MSKASTVTPSRRKERKTLAEKADEKRRGLLRAAAQLVGEFGYAGTSISRIAERAGFAQGTFYLYFEDRQDLFDQLLPTVGAGMLDYVTKAVRGSKDIFEVEERGFRAFFSYLVENPEFFRILHEADVAAPKAFEIHFDLLARRYLSAMKRALERGQIKDYTLPELEVVVYMLFAARDYIYLKFMRGATAPQPLPDWVVSTYLRFIRYGLAGEPKS
ncbi:TetR family transcriptional regulator [Aminobacter aminovorans]|uniref:Uncharacterized HTH-type transcriptional regulator yvdT n=1 Tax=Aminobacter aminovorans TaxID=83263 RepID=A0A381ILY7_AMIAI|nr:TetR/AcrR family transcriptional regulator [Aminobacter aminovorans]TCS25082.1 TetR family transcriptional regulator [Aminobacter aminovorans]SUY28404.1 Uncharacterized HTH-type transcriptional regulator yvdT [Aminobacter aminovorans]